MEEYRSVVNSGFLYLIVSLVLLFIVVMCVVFMVKSYRAGVKMGMEKKVLKKTIISSATFTLLPSISILLGVIALSGSLGVPFSWLRLSVIGALQYELNVAEIAATSLGLDGLHIGEMTVPAFTTIGLVMTTGILGSIICCIFFLKAYLKKFSRRKPEETKDKEETRAEKSAVQAAGEEDGAAGKPGQPEKAAAGKPGQPGKTEQSMEAAAKRPEEPKKGSASGKKKAGFGDYATTAMFIGLCGAYIGSYVGRVTAFQEYTPLFTAVISAAVMYIFEYFTNKRQVKWLDNFSVATSMLVGMVAAVLFQQII